VQRLLTSGPKGWPTGPTLQHLVGQLHGDTLQAVVIGNLKLKVSGGRTPWMPGHVTRSAGHHLVSYRLVEINTPHSNKMGDPGVSTISCLIGTQKFDQALCDLGASVSIMPKVIYNQLNHDSLVPTFMHLQLADQSIRRLVGIVEDIPVRIWNSFIPVDFVVLEMDVCRLIPLILGRPFLSTTGATIDVAAGIIKINISGKEETFTFKPKGIEQCNKVMVTIRLERNAMTPDKKPSAAEKFSTKFSRCVKNAMPTVTSSPVAPVTYIFRYGDSLAHRPKI
jgi:hypothetical protein